MSRLLARKGETFDAKRDYALMSAPRWITGGCVAENWAAVAKAINARLRELGMRQRELAERSHVSTAIIRELQRHTVERHRSARTLEALSETLQWHPDHLGAVLRDEQPLQPGESSDPAVADVATRLGAIEDRLDAMAERLEAIYTRLAAVPATERRGER